MTDVAYLTGVANRIIDEGVYSTQDIEKMVQDNIERLKRIKFKRIKIMKRHKPR